MDNIQNFDNLVAHLDELETNVSFANDPSCLKTDISRLLYLSRRACEDLDYKLFRKAIRMLMRIEDKLWKYYMEVYSK